MSVKLSLLALIESVVYFMKIHVYKPADGYRFILFQMEEKICSIWFISKHILPFHHSQLLLPKFKKPSFFAYTAQLLSEVSFPISLHLGTLFILINICKTVNTWLNQFLSILLYERYTCDSNRLKVSLALASIIGSSVICDIQNLLYKLVSVAGFTPICAEQYPRLNS